MTIVQGIFLYIVFAALLYYRFYEEGVQWRRNPYYWVTREYMREHEICSYAEMWKMIKHDTKETFRLLRLDFLKIHCPWSWESSVRYRVKMAHTALQRSPHKKGWTAEDCHVSANHEQIARDCFMSRKRFWFTEIAKLIFSPLILCLMIARNIILVFFMGAVQFKRWVAG